MVSPVFGVGTWEMVVIAIVAMLLFKPSELPKMLRSVTRFWGQLRATADEFRETIMTADGMDEIQDMIKGTKSELRGFEAEARREMMRARAQMRRAQQKLALTQKVAQERAHPTASGAGAPAEATAVPTPAPVPSASGAPMVPSSPPSAAVPPPPATGASSIPSPPVVGPAAAAGDRSQGAA